MTRALCVTLAIVGIVAESGGRARAEPSAIVQWDRFEASYTPDIAPANPFDPDEIDVRAEFLSPDGRRLEVLGFWNQDYERALVRRHEQLTPVGTPHFTVRFTPDRAGLWSWRWVIRQAGQTQTPAVHFLDVQPANGPGFLRVSTRNSRYLSFDDGSPYFAVGENTAWYDAGGTYDYDDWFSQLAQQHANYGRVWMPSWAFGIEWSDTGLGDYTDRLDRAWQLDYVLEQAERHGIYVMLSLLNHGAFSTRFNSEWASNPYNAANGGPLASPDQFLTNAEAKKLFARRLRYIVARWGWSTHLLAWELWNEVDLTDAYAPATVTAWHAEMAALLRSLDPYRHLVTTSFALFFDGLDVWSGADLDFTQFHFYANLFPQFADLSKTVVEWTQDRHAGTRKPVLFAELGIGDRKTTTTADPGGIGVHDGLWAGVFSGGLGTAMTWWWDNVIDLEPDLYYPMFGSVARFVDGVRWDREAFRAFHGTIDSTSGNVLQYGLRGRNTLLLWIKDDAFQWNAPEERVISDATLQVSGTCSGHWYDPWTGEWLGAVDLDGDTVVPPFSRDLALRATCTPTCPMTGCKTAGASLLLLKNNVANDERDRLLWSWRHGEPTTVADFGNPTETTHFALCLQAGPGAAWIEIPAGPSWKPLGRHGFEFDDRTGAPDGAHRVVLRSGATGKAKVAVKGRGVNLPDTLTPPLSPPVTVQLANDANDACFEAVYGSTNVIENDAKRFKAKAP